MAHILHIRLERPQVLPTVPPSQGESSLGYPWFPSRIYHRSTDDEGRHTASLVGPLVGGIIGLLAIAALFVFGIFWVRRRFAVGHPNPNKHDHSKLQVQKNSSKKDNDEPQDQVIDPFTVHLEDEYLLRYGDGGNPSTLPIIHGNNGRIPRLANQRGDPRRLGHNRSESQQHLIPAHNSSPSAAHLTHSRNPSASTIRSQASSTPSLSPNSHYHSHSQSSVSLLPPASNPFASTSDVAISQPQQGERLHVDLPHPHSNGHLPGEDLPPEYQSPVQPTDGSLVVSGSRELGRY